MRALYRSPLAPLSFLLLALALAPPAWARRVPKGQARVVAAVEAALNDKALETAKVGIYAARADGTGKPIIEYEADTGLHPASNTKVVTTAAAFVLLGPSFDFRTDLFAESFEDGRASTLYLVGRGDPRLLTEGLLDLLDEARFNGLKAVTGDLVVDGTYFEGGDEPPGFGDKPNDDAAYRAPVGALSLNFSAVAVHLDPGREAGAPPTVRLRPENEYVTVENTATTVEKGRERLTVTSARGADGRTVLRVSGTIPQKHRGVVVRKRVDDPALFAGYATKAMLERMGIKVKGKVRVGAAPGKGLKLLARRYSDSLTRLAADVNKWSNNIMAEGLLRAIGKKKGKGDWASGQAAVEGFLTGEVGLKDFTYVNGSGLFGNTRFSPKQLVQVLSHMYMRRPALPEYEASMAIGGRDGTLRKRYKDTDAGRVRAKTGTLNGVSCLTGYVYQADGTPVAFSVLVNDASAPAWQVWKLQDAVVEALIGKP